MARWMRLCLWISFLVAFVFCEYGLGAKDGKSTKEIAKLPGAVEDTIALKAFKYSPTVYSSKTLRPLARVKKAQFSANVTVQIWAADSAEETTFTVPRRYIRLIVQPSFSPGGGATNNDAKHLGPFQELVGVKIAPDLRKVKAKLVHDGHTPVKQSKVDEVQIEVSNGCNFGLSANSSGQVGATGSYSYNAKKTWTLRIEDFGYIDESDTPIVRTIFGVTKCRSHEKPKAAPMPFHLKQYKVRSFYKLSWGKPCFIVPDLAVSTISSSEDIKNCISAGLYHVPLDYKGKIPFIVALYQRLVEIRFHGAVYPAVTVCQPHAAYMIEVDLGNTTQPKIHATEGYHSTGLYVYSYDYKQGAYKKASKEGKGLWHDKDLPKGTKTALYKIGRTDSFGFMDTTGF